MSGSAFDLDDDRRAYESMLARNAWGKPGAEWLLGEAVLEARRRTGVHGGILSREEWISKLERPTNEAAKREYKRLLMKLITGH